MRACVLSSVNSGRQRVHLYLRFTKATKRVKVTLLCTDRESYFGFEKLCIGIYTAVMYQVTAVLLLCTKYFAVQSVNSYRV